SAALVGLTALLVAGIRLGRPLAPAPQVGRSTLEHVAALAGAWRRVPAGRREQELLLEGLRLKLGGQLDDARLKQLAIARPDLAAPVAAIAAALAVPREQPSNERAPTLQWCAAVDSVLAALAASGVRGARTPIRENDLVAHR